MRFARFAPALAFAFTLPAVAEDAAPAAAPAEAAPVEAAPAEEALGPVGHDSQGRPGRIHVVQHGDTLWDISDAYLGTPWVWPSIWRDNTVEVENPHRIYPNERIWISPYEMRKVSEAEAAEMLARGTEMEAAPEPMPAAMADPDGPALPTAQEYYRYSEIQTTGFVTKEELEGAATILEARQGQRTLLSDHTEVVIGLGQAEVAAGDQLDIFRPSELVKDPKSGRQLGRMTNQLGWLEVTAVHDETATAIIRLSRGEIYRGDHLMPRRMRSAEIPVGPRVDVEGSIAHTPNKRLQMGGADVVYVNRGTRDGVNVGTPLEVYEHAGKRRDGVRKEDRALPDKVIAKLIVVDAYDDAAVAVVTHAETELNRGFLVRGTDDIRP